MKNLYQDVKKCLLAILMLVVMVTLAGCKSDEVKSVEKQINEINVESDDYFTEVSEADKTYKALSDKDKKKVGNFDKLNQYREECIKQLIDNKTISFELVKKYGWKTAPKDDAEIRKYVADALTQYQKDDDIENALNLLNSFTYPDIRDHEEDRSVEGCKTDSWDGELGDGTIMYAEPGFMFWVKQKARENKGCIGDYVIEWNKYDDEENPYDNTIWVYYIVDGERLCRFDISVFNSALAWADVPDRCSFGFTDENAEGYGVNDEATFDFDNGNYTVSSGESSNLYSSSSSTKKVCPNCGGTGTVKYYYGSSDLEAVLSGHDPYTLGDCPMCDGTGYVYE